MPRVFLLTNCDDVDVESAANNVDEEDGFSNGDDTNSGDDCDILLNFFFVSASKKTLLPIIDLSGDNSNLDFLLLLSAILNTNIVLNYNTCWL